MDWIPALLKHLAIARSAVVAAFVTSALLLVGHRVAPSDIPPLPATWVLALAAVLVFSACLIVMWGVEAVWSLVKRTLGAIKISRGAMVRLDNTEESILDALGGNPAEPLNLDNIDYAKAQLSRLELMELVRGLSEKGLVDLNPYDSDLVSLTETGRQRALKIHRIASGKE